MSARVVVDLQVATDNQHLPTLDALQAWTTAAIGNRRDSAEISLRIVDLKEAADLNQQWRNKSGPTNVLSFPANLPPELSLPLLGDLVICAPVIEKEAKQQDKELQAHWAHIIIHGTLHLLGYDHIDDQQASEMESLEIKIMEILGFPDPYKDDGC
ncbi:MAG: rRNA maturation RNase YbeY [Endozoicomonas sp. (ex Botrylloides leachii)]|nr:rRNA maturation RNase YbeY [Endozoicomonas sp. (ex Botrylloides leachii)]